MADTPTKDTEAMHIVRSLMSDPEATIADIFDYQIEEARKHVENLCVKRAKLEALNMHKMPYQQIRSLLETYPY